MNAAPETGTRGKAKGLEVGRTGQGGVHIGLYKEEDTSRVKTDEGPVHRGRLNLWERRPRRWSTASEKVAGNGIQGTERRISFIRKRHTSSTARERKGPRVGTDTGKYVGVTVRN